MNDAVKFAAILIVALQRSPAAAQQQAKSEVNSTSWHVPLDASVEQEHVAFLSRGTRLSGTLYYPASHRPAAAVVVLHGASSPSQNLPLYEHLKQMLPPLGIAVFLYDRRTGEGQYDLQILAEDATAARNALASNPRVDAAPIGYWGISQGGWLALAPLRLTGRQHSLFRCLPP